MNDTTDTLDDARRVLGVRTQEAAQHLADVDDTTEPGYTDAVAGVLADATIEKLCREYTEEATLAAVAGLCAVDVRDRATARSHLTLLIVSGSMVERKVRDLQRRTAQIADQIND